MLGNLRCRVIAIQDAVLTISTPWHHAFYSQAINSPRKNHHKGGGGGEGAQQAAPSKGFGGGGSSNGSGSGRYGSPTRRMSLGGGSSRVERGALSGVSIETGMAAARGLSAVMTMRSPVTRASSVAPRDGDGIARTAITAANMLRQSAGALARSAEGGDAEADAGVASDGGSGEDGCNDAAASDSSESDGRDASNAPSAPSPEFWHLRLDLPRHSPAQSARAGTDDEALARSPRRLGGGRLAPPSSSPPPEVAWARGPRETSTSSAASAPTSTTLGASPGLSAYKRLCTCAGGANGCRGHVSAVSGLVWYCSPLRQATDGGDQADMKVTVTGSAEDTRWSPPPLPSPWPQSAV